IYEGNKDVEDHLGIFSAVAEQEEWLMPVWCKMFHQTLAFMHGHGHPELTKKLNDKIPKTVDEIFERVRAFIRGEVALGQQKWFVLPKETMVGSFSKGHPSKQPVKWQPRKEQCENHMIREEGNHKRPFEEGRSGLMNELTFPAIPQSQLIDESIILEGIVEGNRAQKVQGSNDRFSGRNISPIGVNKSSSNHGKGEEERYLHGPDQKFSGYAVFHGASIKIYPLAEPVVHKRRPVAPEGRLALKEMVFYWLGERIIRKVRHPEWITNAIPIKRANGTWKVHMDYSSLKKACSKDMYPFLEEGEELASLMVYPDK
nr:reverse transcriptase domain-containing protein [Tanacetum cinerariifolium]